MTFRGVLKGKTVVLDEKPALPQKTPVLVEIRPLDEADEAIASKHIEMIRNPHRAGRLLYKKREELYDRW